jgi:protein-S-isoprenylcysteine O-methyltransferase Ste14
MYLSLLPLYVGAALLFRLLWAWILLLPVVVVFHLYIVIPEEKYLETKFGETYLSYKRRVRRSL